MNENQQESKNTLEESRDRSGVPVLLSSSLITPDGSIQPSEFTTFYEHNHG